MRTQELTTVCFPSPGLGNTADSMNEMSKSGSDRIPPLHHLIIPSLHHLTTASSNGPRTLAVPLADRALRELVDLLWPVHRTREALEQSSDQVLSLLYLRSPLAAPVPSGSLLMGEESARGWKHCGVE